MKKLIISAICLISIYCIYWFAICLLVPSRLMPAFEQMHQDGLDIRLETPKISGFPSQFKTPLKQLKIVQYKTPLPHGATLGHGGTFINPQLGFNYGLEIDEAIFSARAFWPMAQNIRNITSAILTLPSQGFTAQGSTPNRSHPNRIQIEAAQMDIKLSGLRSKNIQIDGEAIKFTALNDAAAQNIALQSIETMALDYTDGKTRGSVNFTASEIGLDAELLGDLADGLGATIDQTALNLDYTLRLAPDGQPLELMSASLENAAISWGKAQINAFGDITRNVTGLQGELTINIEQSADLLAELRRAEVIDSQEFFAATMMLGSSNDTRSLKLSFRDNVAYLGKIRLIELPF